jgi:hypothetical protein
MGETVTYGQLYNRLRSLGFTERTFDWNGSKRRYFQHAHAQNASVILPDAPMDQPAESMYLLAVQSMLATHGFLNEKDIVLS